MSKKVSQALIQMLNELTNIETTHSKIDAAIFVKKNDQLIKEKVSYLYNLLQSEAESYNQKPDKQFDYVSQLMNIYREKLNMVYDELYLQYVNIQNEIGDARLNQKAIMINYQNAINNSEKNKVNNEALKIKIKEKYDTYEKAIERCQKQFESCRVKLEEEINRNFLIKSSLQVKNENNVVEKIVSKIVNFFSGSQKYERKLNSYEGDIQNINAEKIVKDIREQTVEFVADMLEIKDIDLDEAV